MPKFLDVTSKSAARAALGGQTIVDAADFNVVGDGTTDNASVLASANTAAASGNRPLMISSGTYRINSDVTFSAPVRLLPGAILKPASGVTVKFNAGITTDGLYRVFDHSLGGKCVPLKVPHYHPAWWGSTGSSDDSQTWKDMMLAAQAYSAWQNYGQQRVMVPQGVNRLWEVALSNVHLEGNGRSSLIAPPSTATPGDPVGSDTGYVVKFGGTTTVSGCEFSSGGIAGITVIAWAGSQVNMVQSHVSISGANTIGIYAYGSGLGMRLVDCIIAQGTGVEGQPTAGIGIKGVGTAYDAKLTNVIIWGCDTGIDLQTASWYLTNVHIYTCDYGIDGLGADNTKLVGCWIDRNALWGVRLDSSSNTTFDSTTWFYRNGATSGGGLALSSDTTANRCKGNRIDAVFDDNVGYGVYLKDALQTTGDVRITSSLALNSETPATTTGVYVGSGAAKCEMRVLPSLTWPVTGQLVNNQNATSVITSRATPESQATSGTTTTLSADSTTVQVFTGSANQTVALPTTGVGVGQQWVIINNTSAGALDVKSSDGTSFFTVYTGHSATFRARNYSPSIPAHWAVSSSTAPNSIELGHASDTTLTRSAAGILAVEGVDQVNLTSSQTLTNKTLTTPTLTTPVINGTPSGTGVAVANTSTAYSASTLLQRDSNGGVHASSYFPGRTQVNTAAGTTTMTSGYTQVMDLYGSSTQTVLLPTTGIYAGMQYTIVNRSSGDVTVQSSGANTVATLAGSGSPSAKLFVALKDTPTAATDWRAI